MDYKTRYSRGVELAKNEAKIEAELQKKISQGHTRKEVYGENWKAVNINDVIDRFTIESRMRRKIKHKNRLSFRSRRAADANKYQQLVL